MRKKIKNILLYVYYQYLINTDYLIKKQRKNPLSIPIIIISFNQLFYLKPLVDFLLNRGFENIIIVDNKSTYPPLLNYFDEIKRRVTIEYMDDNYGHKVFFENKNLQKKYGKGYYVITDADILPNEYLPVNFMESLIKLLDKYFFKINKIGFALDLKTIPDSYPLKEKVIKWESQFWETPIEENLYLNWIDTTFALYKPQYPSVFGSMSPYLNGIRVAGNFTAKHGGWYINPNNLTEENIFYLKTVSSSSSWRINEKGEHLSDEYNKFIN